MNSARLAYASLVVLVVGTVAAFVTPLPGAGSLGPLRWSGNVMWFLPAAALVGLVVAAVRSRRAPARAADGRTTVGSSDARRDGQA